MKKTAVIGAGVGGLAVSARLAERGYSVDVFEKLPECGGRAHIIEDRGFKFDTGPSFVLMPDFFREVFEDCGEDIAEYLDLKPLETSYKIFFPDGDTFTVSKDSEKTKSEMERIEPGSSRGFDGFLEYAGGIYKAVEPLLSECMTPRVLANPKYLGLLPKIHPFSTFWQAAAKFFRTDKLKYAFTFESMFMGVSPFETPAFYSVITYSDHKDKIYHPMGGMYEVPRALEKMAKSKGVRFHYSLPAEKVERRGGKVGITAGGKDRDFDLAVINADLPYARARLLGRKLPQYRYSCSVYLIYMGLKKKVRGLEHHNLFFARDLRKNISDIFGPGEVPYDPSFYVHVPTLTDPSLAPEGKDILYVLIPVANLCGKTVRPGKDAESLRAMTVEAMNRITGENIEDLIETEHRFYPEDFVTRYNILNGATFGLAHSLMQSAFFRPPNYEPGIRGVYYAGASTQPGGGLPVVLASSSAAVKLIESGYNS